MRGNGKDVFPPSKHGRSLEKVHVGIIRKGMEASLKHIFGSWTSANSCTPNTASEAPAHPKRWSRPVECLNVKPIAAKATYNSPSVGATLLNIQPLDWQDTQPPARPARAKMASNGKNE